MTCFKIKTLMTRPAWSHYVLPLVTRTAPLSSVLFVTILCIFMGIAFKPNFKCYKSAAENCPLIFVVKRGSK